MLRKVVNLVGMVRELLTVRTLIQRTTHRYPTVPTSPPTK